MINLTIYEKENGETRKPTYKNGGQGLPGFSGGCKSIGEDSVVAGVPGVSVGCVA